MDGRVFKPGVEEQGRAKKPAVGGGAARPETSDRLGPMAAAGSGREQKAMEGVAHAGGTNRGWWSDGCGQGSCSSKELVVVQVCLYVLQLQPRPGRCHGAGEVVHADEEEGDNAGRSRCSCGISEV